MEFFDIFIFNNVKSDLKAILCQQNKVVFKVKVLSLWRLYPYRKPRWAEVGQTYIHIRRNCTLWFWRFVNFANSFVSQEQSNKERLMGVLYTALIDFGRFHCSLSRALSIYLHWRGAFGVVSALYIARWYFLFVTYLIISRYTIMQT